MILCFVTVRWIDTGLKVETPEVSFRVASVTYENEVRWMIGVAQRDTRLPEFSDGYDVVNLEAIVGSVVATRLADAVSIPDRMKTLG